MSETAELLQRFGRAADELAKVTAGMTEAEANFQPAPGKWSCRQIAAHLADAECVMVMRFRQILAEDNPTLIAWNQDRWARHTDYEHRTLADALCTFRQVRSDNNRLLCHMDESGWQRTGTHQERGTMSLLDLVRLATQHAESHTGQIRQVRAEYYKRHCA